MKTTVLVVDDSEMDRRLAAGLLKKETSVNVTFAADGREALEKIAHHPPEIVVTDLQMPNMDGMEAIPFFRSQFPSCPVVVLTGAGTVENSSILFKQGVIDFLSKPVDHERLLGAVKNAVSQSGYKDDYVT